MNKIKNIKQLKDEKRKISKRKTELEKALRYDWRDLKESLYPKNVAEQIFTNIFTRSEKGKGQTFMSESVSGLVTTFAGKLLVKIRDKVDKLFYN